MFCFGRDAINSCPEKRKEKETKTQVRSVRDDDQVSHGLMEMKMNNTHSLLSGGLDLKYTFESKGTKQQCK